MDIFGSGFEQNICGFTHNSPSSYGDEYRNANREKRVDRSPTGKPNDQARNNDGHTRAHISKDMQSGSFRIEVLFLFVQPKANEEINQNTHTR